MKIYTKTGDQGETSLFSGQRVHKDDARLHAYGTVDELNSFLGLAIASGLNADLAVLVNHRQSELFDVGADLATPIEVQHERIKRIDGRYAAQLEAEIDQITAELDPLREFILPGGTPAACTLHVARTVCRRAERWMVSAKDIINPETLVYMNRLSDWLFTVARGENKRAGVAETTWKSRT